MTHAIKRNPSIDLMRFIGLTLIILAHIGISSKTVLFQMRSFDVPLMIFTSGLAFSGKDTGPYLPFIWKRTLRLVLPVYVFVAAYMLLNPFLSRIGWAPEYSSETILNTFALRHHQSMGYVWIIRVFLIVMLVTPPLVRLEKSIGRKPLFHMIVAAMLALQCVLRRWGAEVQNAFIADWLMYVVGYSAVFMLGLRFRHAEIKERVAVVALLAVAMGAMAWYMHAGHGTVLMLQTLKYPPHAYFLVWGALVSTILWATSKWWVPVLDNRLFTFIGRNTIWIYLWHIPFVNIVCTGPLEFMPMAVRYIFIYAASLVIYSIQYKIVKAAQKRWPDNRITGYFIG